MRLILLAITVFSLLVPVPCFACLWDYDTLAMERERFPEAHELIAGHFVRHSTAYYEWRISDRTNTPLDQRTPDDFDDIAVAHDKIGQQDKAIEVIRAKIAKWPEDNRYESEANLGTFLIHAGRYEEGLQHIKRAIEINPDAHFGREVYQKLLVEYVIESRRSDDQLPLNKDQSFGTSGFTDYVLAEQGTADEDAFDVIHAAAKGVMGMMRFGHHDSPILLEAIGDLLLADDFRNDSKMLAARAYLKASYEVDDLAVSAAYLEKAHQALQGQFGREISDIEASLKEEIEQGQELFRRISSDERAWIESNVDLDMAFGEKYYAAPALEINRLNWVPMHPEKKKLIVICVGLAILFVVICVVTLVVRRVRRSRGAPVS